MHGGVKHSRQRENSRARALRWEWSWGIEGDERKPVGVKHRAVWVLVMQGLLGHGEEPNCSLSGAGGHWTIVSKGTILSIHFFEILQRSLFED